MDASSSLAFQLISCFCLGGLLLLQWLALRTVVNETLLLANLFSGTSTADVEERSLGKRIKFRAALIDSSEYLTSKDLLGEVTALLFVRPSVLGSQEEALFTPLVHKLWSNRRGPVYVVCTGTSAECRALRDKYLLGKMHNSGLDIVLDEKSVLRRKFSISSAVRAVVIDESGRVVKVGGASTPDPASVLPEATP